MLVHVETKAESRITGHDPATALIRELIEMTDGAAQLRFHEGHDWASATFTGMRHRLALTFSGSDGVSIGHLLADRLEEHEFSLKRHVVIDIHVAHRVERHEGEPTLLLEIEALTVEDG
ncbi:MAG: hypothetical protein AAGH53_06795 [Pseudomonadota bacterium]